MKKFLLFAVLALIIMVVMNYALTPSTLSPSQLSRLHAAQKAEQFVLVDVFSPKTSLLSFFEKEQGKWVKRFTTKAYIGRNGLGKTWEGDGKSPIGLFRLTQAFGLQDNPGYKGDYIKVTEELYWNGDSQSPTYNRLVKGNTLSKASKEQSEHLIDYTEPYAYALVIEYNKECHPNRGSAIFLHCMGAKTYTAGGVAIDREKMRILLGTLQPNSPILIAPHASISSY